MSPSRCRRLAPEQANVDAKVRREPCIAPPAFKVTRSDLPKSTQRGRKKRVPESTLSELVQAAQALDELRGVVASVSGDDGQPRLGE